MILVLFRLSVWDASFLSALIWFLRESCKKKKAELSQIISYDYYFDSLAQRKIIIINNNTKSKSNKYFFSHIFAFIIYLISSLLF